MRTIVLSSDERREEGLRIVILNGLVVYTGEKDVYRVPDDILRLPDERKIPYELVKRDGR
jgi:hypothetical protein